MRSSARRLLAAATVVAGFVGCAQLIGAEFDGATLAADAAPPSDGTVILPVSDAAFGDARPFDPASVGDLELWFSADHGVTETGSDAGDADGDVPLTPSHGVASWTDRSGKGHHARGDEPSRRPLLERDGSATGPAVLFQPANEHCLTVAWPSPIPVTGLTLFVTQRGNGHNLLRFGVAGAIAFPWNPLGTGGGPDTRLLVTTDAGTMITPRSGSDGASWEVLAARLVAGPLGGLETFRNGRPVERVLLLEGELPALESLDIGCNPQAMGSERFAEADVTELLVFTRALEDPAFRAVEAYLQSRWGVGDPEGP